MTEQQQEGVTEQSGDQQEEKPQEKAPDTGADAEAAVKKLEAEVERLRGIARKQEDRAKQNSDKAKRLDDLEAASASELEKAVKAARAEERAALTLDYHKRIVAAELKAAAGARFEDPNDAVIYIDTSSLISEDGDVDSDAVKAAIDKLLTDKPYLEKKTNRRVPSYDGGARETGKVHVSEPGMGRLRDAYAQATPKTTP